MPHFPADRQNVIGRKHTGFNMGYPAVAYRKAIRSFQSVAYF